MRGKPLPGLVRGQAACAQDRSCQTSVSQGFPALTKDAAGVGLGKGALRASARARWLGGQSRPSEPRRATRIGRGDIRPARGVRPKQKGRRAYLRCSVLHVHLSFRSSHCV